MWFPSIFAFGRSPSGRTRHPRAPARPRRTTRLNLEELENRTLLSSYTAASVSDLIADINAANGAGGSNTITLAKKADFTLTQVNNTSDGANGLPVIAAGDNLTIVGNNNTIVRSYASGTPELRLFDLASGASLTLENLTVQNGDVIDLPFPTQDYGGAIYSNGSLTLTGVIVTHNVGFNGAGVYVAGGTASMSNDTFTNNTCYSAALGGGGAICVAGGMANLTSDTFEYNGAGQGAAPGTAIYVGAGASAVLTSSVVESNLGDWVLFAEASGSLKCCRDMVKGNDGGISGYGTAVDQYTYDHCVGNGINFGPGVSIIQC
jgi:hypothetical protein